MHTHKQTGWLDATLSAHTDTLTPPTSDPERQGTNCSCSEVQHYAAERPNRPVHVWVILVAAKHARNNDMLCTAPSRMHHSLLKACSCFSNSLWAAGPSTSSASHSYARARLPHVTQVEAMMSGRCIRASTTHTGQTTTGEALTTYLPP